MEFEFDKEMDAILRKARGGEVVTSFDTHLDADEISAFAENALSDTARRHHTAHLADCGRCRKILSNVIVLNSEAETETASSAVPAETVVGKPPWYRKLFVFPQLAYAMGGLVLLFSGFFGYLILRNLSDERNVSFSANKPAQAERAAPPSAANTTANTNSPVADTATSVTNSAANSTAPMNAPAASPAVPPLAASNSNGPVTTAEKRADDAEVDAPILESRPQATPDAKLSAKDDMLDADKSAPKPVAEEDLKKSSPTEIAREERSKTENKGRDRVNQPTVDGQSGATVVPQPKSMPKKKEAPSTPVNEQKQTYGGAGASRSVGGKTFNNIGGIWFDSAYGKQKQKTVKRGTSEYLRLDAGLRSIADNLGGTVVILWGGKAYRIQ
jgi:hypothetical protein